MFLYIFNNKKWQVKIGIYILVIPDHMDNVIKKVSTDQFEEHFEEKNMADTYVTIASLHITVNMN